MSAPVRQIKVSPVHPQRPAPSYIEARVLIGEQKQFNLGELTVEQALELAEDCLKAARIIARVRAERG